MSHAALSPEQLDVMRRTPSSSSSGANTITAEQLGVMKSALRWSLSVIDDTLPGPSLQGPSRRGEREGSEEEAEESYYDSGDY